mgnify:CR=1 FL=1
MKLYLRRTLVRSDYVAAFIEAKIFGIVGVKYDN